MLWAILHNDEKQEKQNSDSEGHEFESRRAYHKEKPWISMDWTAPDCADSTKRAYLK